MHPIIAARKLHLFFLWVCKKKQKVKHIKSEPTVHIWKSFIQMD
jgi:hypothetical protein